METLNFQFASVPASLAANPALCGVVGSGNLEILIKTGIEPAVCRVSIKTSARGFGDCVALVWAQQVNQGAETSDTQPFAPLLVNGLRRDVTRYGVNEAGVGRLDEHGVVLFFR